MENFQNLHTSIHALHSEKCNAVQDFIKYSQDKHTFAEQVSLYTDTIQLLSNANDKSILEVLSYIQNIINQALKKMFPNTRYELRIYQDVHGQTTPTINTQLYEYTPDGSKLPLKFKTGTGDGVAQLISFLFTLCLIEIRGVRPLILLDEVLKGFHPSALPLVTDIIQVFAGQGFQFIMVEYDISIGKLYHVVQEQGVSVIKESQDSAEGIYQQDAERLGFNLPDTVEMETFSLD